MKREQGVKRAGLMGMAAVLLGLGFSQNVLAVQSPADCNANNLALEITRDKINTVPGDIVTYSVTYANPSTVGGNVGCDTINNAIDFFCPGPGGGATELHPSSPVNVGDIPAGTGSTLAGAFSCVMPNFIGSVIAKAEDTGGLLDNPEVSSSPFSFAKTITVNVRSCDVMIDKQLSCDGGLTWVDENLVRDNEDGTNGCSTANPNPVMARYFVKNSGTASLDSCVFTESNPTFGAAQNPFGLPADGTLEFAASNTPACSAADDFEPNTAAVNCAVCGGVNQAEGIRASDSATLSCLPVAAKTDRNVSCPVGTGTSDKTLVTADEDGINGCETADGTNVIFGYQAQNTGIANLYDCRLTDNNPLVSALPIYVGTLAPGQLYTNDNVKTTLCSDELEASETPGKRVTLSCCSVDLASDDVTDCSEGQRVTVYDESTVKCLKEGLDVTKTCVPDGQGNNKIVVTAKNSGEAELTGCQATDTIYLNDPTCPPVGEGTNLPLDPGGAFVLGAGQEKVFTAFQENPIEDACNVGKVTCDRDISDSDQVVCPSNTEQCLTRTPGFWGTHPAVTEKYLTVEVCGNTIDNVLAGSSTSAIEAVCSTGTDAKGNPQLNQLVRQCTAAALNRAASAELGGLCSATNDIAKVYGACCDISDDDISVCTGDKVDGYSVTSCIGLLDDFNNSPDTLFSKDFITGKANPKTCQAARGNGILVKPQ